MSDGLPTPQWERIAGVLDELLARRSDPKVDPKLVRTVLALEIEHQFDDDRSAVHEKIRAIVDKHLHIGAGSADGGTAG